MSVWVTLGIHSFDNGLQLTNSMLLRCLSRMGFSWKYPMMFLSALHIWLKTLP